MKTYASLLLLSSIFHVLGVGILSVFLYITIVYALVLFILPRIAIISGSYTTDINRLLVHRSIIATHSLIQTTKNIARYE